MVAFFWDSSYALYAEGTKNDPVQSRDEDGELILASNPTTNENTAPADEEVVDIVDENVYCKDMGKDIIENILNEAPDSPPLTAFKTVTDIQLDTSKTCWQVK